MKKIILTSTLGNTIKVNDEKIPCMIDNTNGLLDILKKYVTTQNKIVIISSDPTPYDKNDFYYNINVQSFKLSDFNFKEVIIVDNRNKNNIKDIICDANIIILSGGHVPTQNKWFKEIKLKHLLDDYSGIIIGISAGSMNSAKTVYACPEIEGEAINKNYERWIEGLNLTNITILPHFNELINEHVDGLNIKEDILLPDSFKHEIYTLNDGSFITIDENNTTIHGECYKVYKGTIKQICKNESKKKLSTK